MTDQDTMSLAHNVTDLEGQVIPIVSFSKICTPERSAVNEQRSSLLTYIPVVKETAMPLSQNRKMRWGGISSLRTLQKAFESQKRCTMRQSYTIIFS